MKSSVQSPINTDCGVNWAVLPKNDEGQYRHTSKTFFGKSAWNLHQVVNEFSLPVNFFRIKKVCTGDKLFFKTYYLRSINACLTIFRAMKIHKSAPTPTNITGSARRQVTPSKFPRGTSRNRLVLLRSSSDTVHDTKLHKTLLLGVLSCCSGLQVTGHR